jgi:hypothetical protein
MRNRNTFMARKKQHGTLPTGSHCPKFRRREGTPRWRWLREKRVVNNERYHADPLRDLGVAVRMTLTLSRRYYR